MKGSRRSALLLAVLLVASACSRVPPGGEAGSGLSSLAEGGSETTDGDFETGFDDESSIGGGAVGTTSGTRGSSTTRRGARSAAGGATQAGAGDGPGSAAAGASTQGLDFEKRTIKVVFHVKIDACGPDAQRSGEGRRTAKGERVVDGYVKWFNDEVLKPYNWKIVYEWVDDGGLYCPEKARAAGLKIAKEIKPFAAIGDSNNLDQGPVLADVITRAGIIHIGSSWRTFDELKARSPLAWVSFGVSQQQYDYLSYFIAKRVKGTKTPDPTTGAGEFDRVYGLLGVDNPEGRKLASHMKSRLAAHGVDLSRIYLVSGEPGVAAQAAATTVQKIQSDEVNTLIFDLSTAGQAGIVYTNAMGSQNYTPDLLIATYGIGFWDRFYDARVWERARGTTIAGIIALRTALVVHEDGRFDVDPRYDEIAENQSGYIKVWKERLGNNDQPQDGSVPAGYGTFLNLANIAAGVMNAEGNLSAASWARGLDATASGKPAHCAQERFGGRDYLYSSYYDWNLAQEGGLKGYATIYWDGTKQTGFGTRGVYESYDKYQYFRTFEELPPRPTYDTAQDPNGPDLPKQPRIGLRPWTPCSKFGLAGD